MTLASDPFCKAILISLSLVVGALDDCGDGHGPKCGSAFSKFQCGTGESCCHDDFNTWCCPLNYKCSGSFADPGNNTHCQTLQLHSQDCVYVPPATNPVACPHPVQMEHGIVCACNASTCGEYPEPSTLQQGEVMIVTSSGNADSTFAQLMAQQIVQTEPVGSGAGKMHMTIDAAKTHQTLFGFGGAFTDAAAHMYEQLESGAKKTFIKQYFGTGGIGYSMGRVPMNSADFSRMDYTMTEPGDFDLKTFCLRDDSSTNPKCGTDYKASLIKDAQQAVATNKEKLKLFVSTWSAAPWYKDQAFTCKSENGVDSCTPHPELSPAMQCNKTVENPETCTTNAQCGKCPTSPYTPLGMNAAATPGSAASRLLQRANLHARTNATAFDNSLCTKTKATATAPMEASAGNCFNTGFLSTNDTVRSSWAKYFSRFISEYKKLGIDVWGLTVQNEPLTQTGLWQGMFYTHEREAEFVAKFLGPIIRKDHPGTKIMVHDDQTVNLLTHAAKILDNPDAAKYIDGVAYHWYNSLEATWENGPTAGFEYFGIDIPIGNLLNGGKDVQTIHDKLQQQGSDKFVLASEACNGFALGTDWVGPRHGDWGYGYAYSHDILWQLKNSASGWTDWNLMLDERGGPNLAGNFVDSPVFKKSSDSSTFYQSPSFFHLAHFAKYITPGSKRVDFALKCGASHEEYCQAVAFETPQNDMVVVMTNDEITVGPIAGGGEHLGMAAMPWLARGEGSLSVGTAKSLSWTIDCGKRSVSGVLPWKGIQTVIIKGGCSAVHASSQPNQREQAKYV